MTDRARHVILFGMHTSRQSPIAPRLGGAVRATISIIATAVLAGLLAPVLAVVGAPPASAAVDDIYTIAGNAVPSSSSVTIAVQPKRVVATANGLLVGDQSANGVRRVDPVAKTQTLLAGNGSVGTPTNGAVATATELWGPADTAVDGSGNIYIADPTASAVYKLTSGGIISRYAGTGGYGSTGDNGPATAATLRRPTGLALDTSGNLYIADAGDNKVRRVSSGGTITTFAGTGTPGLSGDGAAATAAELWAPEDVEWANGTLLIADTGNSRIRGVSAGTINNVAGSTAGFAGDNGPPTSAKLLNPTAIARSGGDLYIADSGNNRIRRITGAVITTVAGGGQSTADNVQATTAQLGGVIGVAVDASGNVYVAAQYAHKVRKVATNGVITTVAGNGFEGFSGDGGQATSAQIDRPAGVAQLPNGDLLIAEPWTGRIRKRATNGLITTVAGGGVDAKDGILATQAFLDFPNDVDVDLAGNVYITEQGSSRIRKVAPNGAITTVAGSATNGFGGDGGPATSAELLYPRGMTVDASGTIFIADSGNNRIRKVAPNGVITTVAGTGAGAFGGDGGPGTAAKLSDPTVVTMDGEGAVLISDTGNNRVRKLTPNGIITTIAGDGTTTFGGNGSIATATGFAGPQGLAVDESGAIFVAAGNRVLRITPVTNTVSAVGGTGDPGFSGDGGPATSARMNNPWAIAVTFAGDLVVADFYSQRVRRILSVGAPGARFHPLTPARILDSRDGTGGFNTPWGPATSRDLQVTGVGGVPANYVGSVVLNVTVTGGTADSHLTVWPTGQAEPTASNLNWPAGDTRPNQVVVKLGASGKVSLFNNSGSVDVIADVVGWYDNGFSITGDTYSPLTPARILDSRDGTGGFNTPWGATTTRNLTVTNVGGVPAGADAVVLNVTVVDGTADSHLTVWPAGQAKPAASSLNWPAGAVRPNLVVVKVGANGQVSLFNNSGTVNVVADVVGYFTPSGGSRFHPTVPNRVLDSRDGTGGYGTPWGASATRTVTVANKGAVPSTATAVILNVTVTGGTADSHLTVWPAGQAKPTASNLNWAAGQTVPNLVVVKVGANGQVSMFNNAGNVDVIADVVGWYL